MNTIIIPIYYKTPTRLDDLSITSLMNNLEDINDYDINFICPKGLDITEWEEITTKGKAINFKIFDSSYFLSTQSYSSLLESYYFWLTFSKYEYALVYQTDGYCIGGNLKEFINMDYDYIGAPIIAENARWFNVPAIGNGGVSLRKVETMIETTNPNGEFIKECKDDIDRHNKYNSNMYDIYEDLYFAQLVPMLWDFKKPKFDVGASFSYDMNADIVYEKTEHKLPLFIHAFDKNIRFWENILDEFKDIDIISDCEWKNKDGYLSDSIGYQKYLNHIECPTVCAIMIVKNENYHLNNQISKLIDNGIRKVFLIDNNSISGENPLDIVDSRYVEVIDKFRGEKDNILSEAYKYVYDNYVKQFSHVMFIDGDEELDGDSFTKIAYKYKDYDVVKIPTTIMKSNGTKSEFQDNKTKSLIKTDLDIKYFTREWPIVYGKTIECEDCKILNYMACNSKNEFDLYKKHRGYPDKSQIEGQLATSDNLYYKVNGVSGIKIE